MSLFKEFDVSNQIVSLTLLYCVILTTRGYYNNHWPKTVLLSH